MILAVKSEPILDESGTTTKNSLESNRWSLLLLAAAALYYIVFIWRTRFGIGGTTYFCLFDDAMISMRYASNLAAGHGLVWNAGQAHVEGYTNFFWTLWMAAIHLMPIDNSKTSLVVMGSGATILLLNGTMAGRVAAQVSNNSRFVGLLSVASVLFYYPLIFWTLRGMEVGLISLLVLCMVFQSNRLADDARVGIAGSLGLCMLVGILTRDDVVLPCAIVTGFTLASLKPRTRLMPAAILCGAILLAVAGHTAFRIVYYGDVLPNTYHLKMEGVSTAIRVSRGAVQFVRTCINHLAVPICLSLVCLICGKRVVSKRVILLASLVVGQCLYSVYVGADAWEWMQHANRYISVVAPELLILAALGIEQLFRADSRTYTVVLRVLMFVLASLTLLGIGGVYLSTVMHVSLNSHPALFKLADRIVPSKIATGTLALFFLMVCLFSRRSFASGLTEKGINLGRTVFPKLIFAGLSILVVSGDGIGRSSLADACEVDDDASMTQYALDMKEVTDKTATIAVARAGALTYFSERNTVDLLGKSDRFVARSKPIRPFYPGHNKQVLSYSLGQLHPDIVAELVDDPKVIEKYGYTAVSPSMFVLKRSTHVNFEELKSMVHKGFLPLEVHHPPTCLCESPDGASRSLEEDGR